MDRSQLTSQRAQLPDFRVESDADRSPLLRPGRALLLLLLHDASCPACRSYVERIFAERAEFDWWGADIAAVIPQARSAIEPGPIRRLYDPGRSLAERTGAEFPGLLLVDQWGDIVERHQAGAQHAFPATDDVVSWVRFLGTQCPECEGEAL